MIQVLAQSWITLRSSALEAVMYHRDSHTSRRHGCPCPQFTVCASCAHLWCHNRWPSLQCCWGVCGHCLPVPGWRGCREYWLCHPHSRHPALPHRLQVSCPQVPPPAWPCLSHPPDRGRTCVFALHTADPFKRLKCKDTRAFQPLSFKPNPRLIAVRWECTDCAMKLYNMITLWQRLPLPPSCLTTTCTECHESSPVSACHAHSLSMHLLGADAVTSAVFQCFTVQQPML